MVALLKEACSRLHFLSKITVGRYSRKRNKVVGLASSFFLSLPLDTPKAATVPILLAFLSLS
jgi:hypothetical protein